MHIFVQDQQKLFDQHKSLIQRTYGTTKINQIVSMSFSENNTTWTTPTPYSEYYNHTIQGSGDGTKTIYVKVKDSQNRWSSVASDTIILDMTGPAGTVTINPTGDSITVNGTKYTNSPSINLSLSAADNLSGMDKMKFSTDGTNYSPEEAYASSKPYTFSGADGAKTIYVRYKDRAGNWSLPVTDSITLDRTPPTGSILINNGDETTATSEVMLTLSANDTGVGMGSGAKMLLSNDGTNFTEYAYATQKRWTLSEGESLKTVYVKYKDPLGNTSTRFSDSITLDILSVEEKAYQFLINQMDKYITADISRLVESYTEPYPPAPYDSHTNREDLYKIAFTYDNATTAICLILKGAETQGQFDDYTKRAKQILQALVWHLNHDPSGAKRLRDAYYADQNIQTSTTSLIPDAYDFSKSNLGSLSWTIIALLRYYEQATDTDQTAKNDFLQAAKDIAEFIHTNLYDSQNIGYFHNIDKYNNIAGYKSAEQNIDAYIAFAKLYLATDDITYIQRADYAKRYVEEVCWDSTENKYFCGSDADNNPNTYNLVEDINSYANLALGPQPQRYLAMDWLYNNLKYTDLGFVGFDFGINIDPSSESYSPTPDGVWFEGTAHASAAYKVLGFYNFTDRSQQFIDALIQAQGYAQNTDGLGIVAASHDGVTTGFTGFNYYSSGHIAATSWFLFALKEHNPFWGIPTDSEIPQMPQILSITISPKSWNIGSIRVNSTNTMPATDKIVITNDGTGPETLELKLIPPDGWNAASVPAIETFVLSGLFCSTIDVPQATSFNQGGADEDIIIGTSKKATNTTFAYLQATANGVAIPSGTTRSLYLQFKSPTITARKEEQDIAVIVSAQVP